MPGLAPQLLLADVPDMLTSSPNIVVARSPRRRKPRSLPPDLPVVIRPRPEPEPDHTGADAADQLFRDMVERIRRDASK